MQHKHARLSSSKPDLKSPRFYHNVYYQTVHAIANKRAQKYAPSKT